MTITHATGNKIKQFKLTSNEVAILKAALRQCKSDYFLRVNLSRNNDLKKIYQQMTKGLESLQMKLHLMDNVGE